MANYQGLLRKQGHPNYCAECDAHCCTRTINDIEYIECRLKNARHFFNELLTDKCGHGSKGFYTEQGGHYWFKSKEEYEIEQ